MGKNRAGIGAGSNRAMGEEIEIEDTRRVGHTRLAAEIALDLKQNIEQGPRFQGRLNTDHAVDEPWLVGYRDRGALIKRRTRGDRDPLGRDGRDGGFKGFRGVAEIG